PFHHFLQINLCVYWKSLFLAELTEWVILAEATLHLVERVQLDFLGFPKLMAMDLLSHPCFEFFKLIGQFFFFA
ncbi:MAG: hypothetical protein ACK55Z_11730, partial [bacterium]